MKFNINFRDWLREKELNEAIKERTFNISINGIDYVLYRDQHLFDKSRNDNKPKDFSMSKTKYLTILNLFINSTHNTNLNKPVTVTWQSNNKNNAISFNINIQTHKINVFGAIMNSTIKDPMNLYVNAQNRFDIGVV